MRPPRVYLCPSTVAGIPSRLELVGRMRELARVVPDLPEDLGSFLVLVLLQAFWCPDSDSNTLPMV